MRRVETLVHAGVNSVGHSVERSLLEARVEQFDLTHATAADGTLPGEPSGPYREKERRREERGGEG